MQLKLHNDINVREYRRANQKMDNLEKLATQDPQGEEKQAKSTTWYVLDTNLRKQTQSFKFFWIYMFIRVS